MNQTQNELLTAAKHTYCCDFGIYRARLTLSLAQDNAPAVHLTWNLKPCCVGFLEYLLWARGCWRDFCKRTGYRGVTSELLQCEWLADCDTDPRIDFTDR